jgi:hypothetical protein
MLSKATNVLETINEDIQPLSIEHRYQWDLRLDWQKKLSYPVDVARVSVTPVGSE